MKVSIVTITLNNASGLERTLQSITEQTFRDMEIIVVDGKSTDGTKEVLDKYGNRIRVIEREPAGVYDAINAGIEAARGEVTGLLHAGDTFTKTDILERVMREFGDSNAPDYIYGDVHFANPGESGHRRYYSGALCSRRTIERGYAPPHPSLFIQTRAMKKAGPYSTDYKVAADFEMFVRLFFSDLRGKYVPLDMVCMQPGGLSGKWRNRLMLNNAEKMRALRSNNVPASWIRILTHYIYVFKKAGE